MRKLLERYSILITFVFCTHLIYADNNLVYPIKNFATEEYKAETQNWGITRLSDGTMCFANNAGLLVKNGNEWYTYPTLHAQILRVICEHNNKIYVGGTEFGYFIKEISGKYRYVPLSENINTPWGEIWRIKILNNKVYFQGGGVIFAFNTNDDKIDNQISIDNILYLGIGDNNLYIQTKEMGLFSLDSNFENRKTIIDKGTLNDIIIRNIHAINGYYYLFSLNSGIYKYAENRIAPCKLEIQEILKKSQIYCSATINNQIVIGTVLDDIYITDYEFNIKTHINTSTELKNNTVLSLFIDYDSNVWAGLDNGISHLSINSPYQYYKFNKNIGSGYTSFKKEKLSYWGSNQGLFYTNENDPQLISLIDGTQGQVWCLKNIHGNLYCGHNNGLYEVVENKAIKVGKDIDVGVMNIIQLNENPDYYLLTTYRHPLLYKYNTTSNKLEELGRIESTFNIPRHIKIDKDGWLWSFDTNKIVKFKIDTNKLNVTQIKEYEMEGHKLLFKFGDGILVWYNNAFYTYNKQGDEFEKNDTITCSPQNRDDLLELLYYIDTDVLAKQIKNYKEYIGNIPKIKNQLKWNVQLAANYGDYYILNANDGFIYYNFNEKVALTPNLKIVISEIQVKAKSDLEYNWLTKTDLEYKNNNIRFKFSSNDNSELEYQYKLIGFDENYSTYSAKNNKEYMNLPEGSYIFEVRTKDMMGNVSQMAQFEFTVKPPFYRSPIAKTIYIVFLIFLLTGFYYLTQFLILRKEKQLNAIRLKEIEELEKSHKIKTLNQERTIILMEKDNLEDSITHKQRELANSTHNVIVKNNLLIEIKSLLQSIYKEKNVGLRDSKLEKIFHLVDSNIDNEDDWAIFENYFSEIHQTFFNNIKHDFPDISTTDLKLCAYIKLNKSTKEIAILMNISIRGVETSRYRLRKKLNLSRDENIIDILSKY